MERCNDVARWFLMTVGSVLSQSLVQVQVAHPVLDLPRRRHDLQHRPPAKSADQLVDQPVDVGHGVRLSPPEKTHPMAVCSRAEAVGGTNRLIMAVVPGTTRAWHARTNQWQQITKHPSRKPNRTVQTAAWPVRRLPLPAFASDWGSSATCGSE